MVISQILHYRFFLSIIVSEWFFFPSMSKYLDLNNSVNSPSGTFSIFEIAMKNSVSSKPTN